MFRFTIRDVLWLTVVVGLVLGWYLRERQLQNEIRDLNGWRLAAGALEDVMREDGWTVEWGYLDNSVLLKKRPGRFQGAASVHTSRVVTQHEPSAEQP